MATEGPLQVPRADSFPKNAISNQQPSVYPTQRENYVEASASDQSNTNQQQPTGSLMRGYSFLADQIYRSVSNPLYKLVQTVEDTVGGENLNKQTDEVFRHGYQGYQTPSNLKFESNGNFEGEGVQKIPEQQQDLAAHQLHRQQASQQQNFSNWEVSTVGSVQQWYPRNPNDVPPHQSSDVYNNEANWPTAHGSQSDASKSDASPSQAPPQSSSPNKASAAFQQAQQNRYHQQYFQEWNEANSSGNPANQIANPASFYPPQQQQQFDASAVPTGSSTSPQISEEINFAQQAVNNQAHPDASSCPGCCVPGTAAAATPHQNSVYPESSNGGELQNGLCLVDPMRALPRYLTSGLWPPVINPPKLEWNGGSGMSEDDARLLEMNRFYGEGNYRMSGGTAAGNVYQGYPGVQDTKDFFFAPSRYSNPGDAVFRQKSDAHRLSVAAAVSAVDCDPQELEAFAERFKQRRIKLGVTQADVGKALGRLNLAGVGSFSQSTICRFESLTLSHNNMLALKPILQAWLDEAEQEAAARQKNPNAYDLDDEDKKRKRTSITDPEKRSLEAFFGIQPRPSSEKIAQIAEKLNLKKNVVRVWFCNQRQKQKRMKFSTVGLLHQVNGM